MKAAKILVGILAIAFMFSFAGMTFAADDPAAPAEVTVTGVLENVDGAMIVDGNKLAGEVDAAMVGKKVEVTGTVAEVDGVKVLTVTAIKAVE